MSKNKKFKLRVMEEDGDDDTAYLMMPNHPGAGNIILLINKFDYWN